MKGMRLTLVISSLARGGAERVLSILAGAWAEQGHEVTLLSFDHGEAPAYALHPSVTRLSLGLLEESHGALQGVRRNLGRIRILRRAIRQSRPDLVVSFLDRVNVLTLLATLWMRVPVIVSERIDPSRYDIGSGWSFLRRLLYPLADLLVCQTEAALARFQALTRVRGVAIPNPVCLPPGVASRPTGENREPAHHALIAMGRLVPQKGFDLLLQAFSRIAVRHPAWTLTVWGDGPLLEELQTQANSLDLSQRVRFPGATADPFSKLSAADLFVFSSRFEGFGMALAEAMACGLPVISFDCPEGPALLIRDGVDGLLVPPENVDGLSAALDRLMSDPGERARFAVRAPEVLDRFSLERVLPLWQDVFVKLVPNWNSSSKKLRP